MLYYFLLFLAVFMTISAANAGAAIKTEDVEYKDGETVLQGYLAYDNSKTGTRPVVIIFHEWWGLNDYAKGRARQLAELGYLAFAADIFGKGIRPKDRQEAIQQAGIYRNDNKLFRSRITTALDFIRKNPMADNKRIAAIGYCFGGGAALELARTGADINGVVSFHGNVNTPHPEDAKNIKCKVLILHGADDPAVPLKDVNNFEDVLRNAGVDWQVNIYSKAVHAFTNPDSGNDPSKGAAYNAEADRRSWQAMMDFFGEIFK